MWTFLIAADNVPFTASLVLMLLIGAVELVGLGGGLAAGDAIDGFDGEVEAGAPSLLSWLNVGRLPLLMLIVVFLFSFGMIGLIGQRIAVALLGATAPWLLTAPAAFAVALPATRVFAAGVARIMPRDESSAVSRDSLVGRIAVIVTGEARPGSAAQARVRDAYGKDHYVMVEPDNDGDVFEQGRSVLLVRRAGARFYGIHNPSASLGT